MITVTILLRLSLLMDLVIIMDLNGSGCMDFMWQRRFFMTLATVQRNSWWVCYKNITITSTMMNGVHFLKWLIRTENLTDSHVQPKLGRFQVCWWLGMLSTKCLKKDNKWWTHLMEAKDKRNKSEIEICCISFVIIILFL